MKKTLITAAAATALVLQSCKSDVDPSEAKRGECCITQIEQPIEEVAHDEQAKAEDYQKLIDEQDPYNLAESSTPGPQGDAKYRPEVRDYTQGPHTEKEAALNKKMEAIRDTEKKRLEEKNRLEPLLPIPTK